MSDTTTPADRDEIERATEQLHVALDAVPWSIHGREGDWVDGGAETVAAALVEGGWTPPNRDHAAADMAHRDDLARDVGAMWAAAAHNWGPPVSTVREVYPDLAAALDRLASVYGTQPEEKP